MAKYGPNSADVEALIVRARALTLEEARAFHATFSRQQDPRWPAAFDAIQQATLTSGRNDAYIAAYDDFVAAIDRSPGGRALGSATPSALIREVVTATVVRDLLPAHHYEYMVEPWRLVIEQGFRPPVDPTAQYIDLSAPARPSGCLLPISTLLLASMASCALLVLG
jgi:hypothetical protein